MVKNYKPLALFGIAAIVAPALLINTGYSSDHADTPQIAKNPGTDLTDVYLFPSPEDKDKVVLIMNVNPLIVAGGSSKAFFDPNVLYQFKIDNTGDAVEDLVIQARFSEKGPNQNVTLMGPSAPTMMGAQNSMLEGRGIKGALDKEIKGPKGMRVFVGAREDSFFFDLERFFAILPDRASSLSGKDVAEPNKPQMTSWRAPGEAVDFLSNGGFNVLSIVVELPKSALRGKMGSDKEKDSIAVWATTSVPDGKVWMQRDRLARPAVNEVFATVANNRHKINDEATPNQDAKELRNDIMSFMTGTAGRSEAVSKVVAAVLVPDVLRANLKGDKAAYLGAETNGATGGKFGGRGLADDVVDISLGAIFGTTISDLGLAPADGKQIPTLISDNVGADGKHFTHTFPYIGAPR